MNNKLVNHKGIRGINISGCTVIGKYSISWLLEHCVPHHWLFSYNSTSLSVLFRTLYKWFVQYVLFVLHAQARDVGWQIVLFFSFFHLMKSLHTCSHQFLTHFPSVWAFQCGFQVLAFFRNASNQRSMTEQLIGKKRQVTSLLIRRGIMCARNHMTGNWLELSACKFFSKIVISICYWDLGYDLDYTIPVTVMT